MPLLNRPKPVISQRQYRVRIDEPLAVMMERYAEFLDRSTVDHVIAEALDFVFKKDTQFKGWLASHSSPSPKPLAEAPKPKPNGSTMAGERDRGTPATARITI